MTFIRAPYIDSVGDGVEVLAAVDEHIVAAQYGKQLDLAFHPELDVAKSTASTNILSACVLQNNYSFR